MTPVLRSIFPAMGIARAMPVAFGLMVGVGAQAPARAQTQAAHDIPWYMANDRTRAATIALCRNDHSFERDAYCANAETAENRLWAERASAAARGVAPSPRPDRLPEKPGDILRSTTYWLQNPLSRIGTLAACRTPGTSMTPEQCAAARRADLMARNATAGGR